MTIIPTERPISWVQRRLMSLVFMICRVMFGNGVGTGMIHIQVAPRQIRGVLIAVPTGCYVAVAGAILRATARFPFVPSTTLRIATAATASGSAFAGLSPNLLDFYLFTFYLGNRITVCQLSIGTVAPPSVARELKVAMRHQA